MRTGLESERVVVASPASWTGSTQRLWRTLRPRAAHAGGWRKAAWWTLLWTVLILAWALVAAWYALLAAFGLVPLLVLVVYRCVRRSQRKARVRGLRHAELMSRDRP